MPGGHTRAWGRFSHVSPLTHRDACRPQGLDPPWGSSVGTGPRSLSRAPVGPEPCFMLHPSRPISNDSLLPICMGICIVSLTLFHQARVPTPEPGPPSKPRHVGTPNGAVGTSGFQSYPSPPESIPELSPSPLPGLYPELSSHGVLHSCEAGWGRGRCRCEKLPDGIQRVRCAGSTRPWGSPTEKPHPLLGVEAGQQEDGVGVVLLPRPLFPKSTPKSAQ